MARILAGGYAIMKRRHSGPDKAAYRNPKLPVARRVKDLLSRMTLKEKAAQMLCIWQQKSSTLVDEKGNFDLQKARKHFKERLRPWTGRAAQRRRRRQKREGNGRADQRHPEVLSSKTAGSASRSFFMRNVCTAMLPSMAQASPSRSASAQRSIPTWSAGCLR